MLDKEDSRPFAQDPPETLEAVLDALKEVQTTLNRLTTNIINHKPVTRSDDRFPQQKVDRRFERDIRMAHAKKNHQASQERIRQAYLELLVQLGRKPFASELARAAKSCPGNARWFLSRLDEQRY